MTRMPRIAFVLLLGSVLAPGLAGCGLTPGTGTTPSTSAQAASTSRPTVPAIDVQALAKVKSSLGAMDYGVVSESKNTATQALYQYNDLRNQWLATYDNNAKDNLEQQMLGVLTQAASTIEGYTNGGCCDTDNQAIYSMASNALNEYNSLRNQWMSTYDVNQKRNLVNQMLVDLTGAIQSINQYTPVAGPSPYNPNPYNPYNPSPYNPNPYNPYNPNPYNPYGSSAPQVQ